MEASGEYNMNEINTKKCTKCNINKPFTDFHKNKNNKDGRQFWCKICVKKEPSKRIKMTKDELILSRKETCKKYYLSHKNKINDNLTPEEIERKKESRRASSKKYSDKNREIINKKARDKNNEYRKLNPSSKTKYDENLSEKEKRKIYLEKNKSVIKQKKKKYREENRDKIRKYHKEYCYNKNNSNIEFKLAKNLRGRLYTALKHGYKSGSAVKDLGCTIQEFKIHIENQFEEGMTWENYGLHVWHLDHRIGLANFDLTKREDLLKACHYTNLKPMWAKDNICKKDSILPEDIEYAKSLGVSI